TFITLKVLAMALDFFAGCVGGVAGVIVGHPLDTVKVHLQTQDLHNPKYRGTVHCLRSIISKEGIRGVYRGVTSPLLGVAGINAIVFGVYGNVQRKLSNPDSLASHALAGGTAGLFQSFICSPMELAKSRLQVGDPISKGPLECLMRIYTNEGFRGVFRGGGLTIGREVPSFAIYFFTYEMLTKTDSNMPVSTWGMLLAGGLAGVASWTVTYPIDMIKSRIQVDEVHRLPGLLEKKPYGAVAFPACLGGLTPTIIRAFPVNAVIFTVVAWTMRILTEEELSGTVKETELILEKYADVVCTLKVSEKSPT
ncbi:hypothetical protein NQ317_004312, partial [Molorchus minor]